MLKLRLHGLENDIKIGISDLKKTFEVLSVSDLYKDKGQSKYYRCYVEVKMK